MSEEIKHKSITLVSMIILTLLAAGLSICAHLKIPQPPFVYFLGSLYIPYTGVQLSYVGFILPLFISIYFCLYYSKNTKKFSSMTTLAFVSAMVTLAILSYLIPSLQHIDKGVGSHLNYLISAVCMFWFFFLLLYKKDLTTLLLLSYPIFFLNGALSDSDSLVFFKSDLFGGANLYDGDFLIPLIFFVFSFWIWYFFGSRRSSKGNFSL